MDEHRGWSAERAVPPGAARRGPTPLNWIVRAVLGAVLMVLLGVLGSVRESELLALIPLGIALGVLAGPTIRLARVRLTEPNAAVAVAPAVEPRPGPDLRPAGIWARTYLACVQSVTAYHRVVDTVPPGAGRDWLANIGVTLDRELAEALRLARLGETAHPDDSVEPSETAQRVLDRLRTAEKAFADTTDRAVSIALDLRNESDFVHVRAQLDLLAEQAPRLLRTDA